MHFSDDKVYISRECVLYPTATVLSIGANNLPMKLHACGQLSAIFCLLTEKIAHGRPRLSPWVFIRNISIIARLSNSHLVNDSSKQNTCWCFAFYHLVNFVILYTIFVVNDLINMCVASQKIDTEQFTHV